MEERMLTVEQEVFSIKATLEHLATKSDLTEVKTDIAKLDAKLEKSVSDLKSDLTWRMFGMVVGLMVAVASVVAVAQTVFD
jgi:hypothetical protein